jgi:Spy/CpxP family protein refolding chaperone
MSVVRFLPMFALSAMLVGPLAAGAQTAPAPAASAAPMTGSPHHHRHHHPSFMHALHAVTLTPAQQQQVAAFHDQETKANLNADPAAKKANAQKMREEIMGILTPDQKTQLTAQMHAHNHMPAMAPDPAASPGAN